MKIYGQKKNDNYNIIYLIISLDTLISLTETMRYFMLLMYNNNNNNIHTIYLLNLDCTIIYTESYLRMPTLPKESCFKTVVNRHFINLNQIDISLTFGT